MTAGNPAMTLKQLYGKGRQLLESAALDGCDSRREAALLLERAAGLDRGGLHRYGGEEADEQEIHRFLTLCARRAAGEPLQYLLGQWEFYSLPFFVGPGVLIPRPETELLVDLALELLGDCPAPRLADLCSGSGCVAVALARSLPGARVWAVERSRAALGYLYRNLELNQAEDRVTVVEGDVLSPLTLTEDGLDLVLANPPYIPRGELDGLQAEVRKEPAQALDGGEDGLDFYRAIPGLYFPLLREGGALAMEIGWNQEARVRELLERQGFEGVDCRRDLSGHPRVVLGFKLGRNGYARI